jgi:hypothetical protein
VQAELAFGIWMEAKLEKKKKKKKLKKKLGGKSKKNENFKSKILNFKFFFFRKNMVA